MLASGPEHEVSGDLYPEMPVVDGPTNRSGEVALSRQVERQKNTRYRTRRDPRIAHEGYSFHANGRQGEGLEERSACGQFAFLVFRSADASGENWFRGALHSQVTRIISP